MNSSEILWKKAVQEINADENCRVIYDFGQRGRGATDLFPDKQFKTINIAPGAHPDIVADAHHTGLPSGGTDAILSLSLLEHCHSPHVVVEEMRRILKPYGRVLISVPFIHPYHGAMDDGMFCPDYYRFTKDGLDFLFKDFDYELASDGGFFFALTSFFPRFMSPFLMVLERLYPRGNSRHAYLLSGRRKY